MSKSFILSFLSFLALSITAIAQPYVVNEKLEKIFSEGFTDVNDHFVQTPSNDPKFWGKYADGYYYMERKIASPRAIVVNAKPITKNFSIKSKLTLGPVGGSDASVGIMFLVPASGRGGFVFEMNKKKSFRIQDLGTSAYITKEGVNGWIKSKELSPATRSNTVEIKSFRGKFDIYVNGAYLYSFINDSYKRGKYGTYIGPNAAASLYYFNAYNLDIPSAEPEIDIEALNAKINSLKVENDSLKTLALTAKYGGNNNAAISAIKILEDQLKAVNEENVHVKKILKEYEESEPVHSTEEIKKDQQESDALVEKIGKLSSERDSVVESTGKLRNKLFQVSYQRDSLRDINVGLMKKMDFLEAHMQEVQAEIDKIKRKPITEKEIVKSTEKEPATPSKVADKPIIDSTPIPGTAVATELVKQDSTYDHTIDIDDEVGISIDSEEVSLIDEPIEEVSKPEIKKLIPISEQQIKVKKAVKAEFKD